MSAEAKTFNLSIESDIDRLEETFPFDLCDPVAALEYTSDLILENVPTYRIAPNRREHFDQLIELLRLCEAGEAPPITVNLSSAETHLINHGYFFLDDFPGITIAREHLSEQGAHNKLEQKLRSVDDLTFFDVIYSRLACSIVARTILAHYIVKQNITEAFPEEPKDTGSPAKWWSEIDYDYKKIQSYLKTGDYHKISTTLCPKMLFQQVSIEGICSQY
ncbi:hypothetical protein JW710_04405 [Candidatus Dojkabacteria bacterium]|nr:hypothetical protein [Candidatus Dojkabacteria bacterium]